MNALRLTFSWKFLLLPALVFGQPAGRANQSPTLCKVESLPSLLRLVNAERRKSGACGTGSWTDTPPQVGSCRATFGCCTGTIKKSATYEIPFVQSAGAALSVNLLNTKERQKPK